MRSIFLLFVLNQTIYTQKPESTSTQNNEHTTKITPDNAAQKMEIIKNELGSFNQKPAFNEYNYATAIQYKDLTVGQLQIKRSLLFQFVFSPTYSPTK